MSCCSDRRSAASLAPALRAAAAVAPTIAVGSDAIALRYVGKTALALRGPFSEAVYRIWPSDKAIMVDPRDFDALLRTGLFER